MTPGHIGFSCWHLIFKKYPVPSIDNIFVLVKYVQSGCNRNTDFQTVPLLCFRYTNTSWSIWKGRKMCHFGQLSDWGLDVLRSIHQGYLFFYHNESILLNLIIRIRTMGPETGNNPCVSGHMIHFGGDFTLSSRRGEEFATIDIWYILADILRCSHNEVKNSQRWTLIARQLFTTHRFWYEFNIFLTSDYPKRWWDIYNAEHWILKLQSWFWFVKLNVGCSTGML